MAKPRLSDKQAAFVRYFLESFNGTQAAIKAGYSEKAARTQASRLLANDNVQDALAVEAKKTIEKSDATKQEVLQEIAAIAFSDIGQVMDWGPDFANIKSPDDIPVLARRAIKRITCTKRETDRGTYTTTSVEMHEKIKGLEFLFRYWSLADAGSNTATDGDSKSQLGRVLDAARRIAERSRKGESE